MGPVVYEGQEVHPPGPGGPFQGQEVHSPGPGGPFKINGWDAGSPKFGGIRSIWGLPPNEGKWI